MNYNYPYYAPTVQQMPQIQPQSLQPTYSPPTQQTMQNGGFMSVASEQIARNYPVAPGNVLTFKIENQPYVCEKAQGFSQLESPTFNKYRLVKEEDETVEVYDTKVRWNLLKKNSKTLKKILNLLMINSIRKRGIKNEPYDDDESVQ